MSTDLLAMLRAANPVDPGSVSSEASSAAAAALVDAIVDTPPLPAWWRVMHRGRTWPFVIGRDHPLIELRAADPGRTSWRLDGDEWGTRAALLDGILADPDPHHLGKLAARVRAVLATATRRLLGRAGRRRLALPIIVGTLIAASAATIALTRRPTIVYQSTCYAAASVHSDGILVSGGTDPLARCSDAWARGAFGAPRRPHLVACVFDGQFAVFPGRDYATCAKLGLAAALSPTARAQSIARLEAAAVRFHAANACPSAAATRAVMRAKLARVGLDTWLVIGPSNAAPSRPCATIALDARSIAAQQVVLIDTPRPGLATGPTSPRRPLP